MENSQAEILFITSYPPRVCGIATYSQDLIRSLNNKFSQSFRIIVCALESEDSDFIYPAEVKYVINTTLSEEYIELAQSINAVEQIKIVLIQHEFGFFRAQESSFLGFLRAIKKPVIIVFHTVLPHPDNLLKEKVLSIAAACESLVVMTKNSARVLADDYGISKEKITVIAHGTHLVHHLSKEFLKKKYGLKGRKVLTTFGLLSSGKSIETTLSALPAIIKEIPEVIFLVIGKTHPEVLKEEGEKYRVHLEAIVSEARLENHVRFINKYLDLPDLLEHLQLTDIYLFTSNDPNQAVSGTFVYAMSCACPIISTPIPHAKEVLTEDTGIIIDFRNSTQLSEGVIRLFNDEPLRKKISMNTLQKIVPTAWENSAIAHAMLFERIAGDTLTIRYSIPDIKLDHFYQLTTHTGMIQFSKVNQPDLSTGYTLDDNARALIVMCMYYKRTRDKGSIFFIRKYLSFISQCLQPAGDFLNYMDQDEEFTEQNRADNLDDANGRAIWALGYLVSFIGHLPLEIVAEAEVIIAKALLRIGTVHSPRAMAFSVKGIYSLHSAIMLPANLDLLKTLANRLVEMYKHESNEKWQWFEGYLTYANSILPEAMLYAWQVTCEPLYKEIAITSLNFLLSQTFNENGIKVISNNNWLMKGKNRSQFGEQPIDVAYTIMTLSRFYDVLKDEEYLQKLTIAFSWFLGNNHLHQIIYNPCTGGCYDGLEETQVNLNQGAESTVSYLMARLTIEKYR